MPEIVEQRLIVGKENSCITPGLGQCCLAGCRGGQRPLGRNVAAIGKPGIRPQLRKLIQRPIKCR